MWEGGRGYYLHHAYTMQPLNVCVCVCGGGGGVCVCVCMCVCLFTSVLRVGCRETCSVTVSGQASKASPSSQYRLLFACLRLVCFA